MPLDSTGAVVRAGDPVPEAGCHILAGRKITDGDGCACFVVGHVQGIVGLVRGFRPCPAKLRERRNRRAPPPAILLEHEGPSTAHSEMTGDFCLKCQQFSMVRTGTCLTCVFCGDTSGGCS